MSDHETWNMFAATSYAAWMAGGDYAAEECRTRAVADADWFVIESKKRAAPAPTPPQPDDDGWIKWEGGECPVPPTTLVKWRCAECGDDNHGPIHAGKLIWNEAGAARPITAYRIVPEAGVTK